MAEKQTMADIESIFVSTWTVCIQVIMDLSGLGQLCGDIVKRLNNKGFNSTFHSFIDQVNIKQFWKLTYFHQTILKTDLFSYLGLLLPFCTDMPRSRCQWFYCEKDFTEKYNACSKFQVYNSLRWLFDTQTVLTSCKM